jgi:O-succinylhomoserine sulfhydrylase
MKNDTGQTPKLAPRTRAVHAGTRRSQYGEVSEALFLTQGFVYDSAEAAEAKKGTDAKASAGSAMAAEIQ